MTYLKKLLGLMGILALLGSPAFGIINPAKYNALEQQTRRAAKEKLDEVLVRYCGQFCEVVNIQVVIDEKVPDGEDMGFEGAVTGSSVASLVVSKLVAEIQIDDRVGKVNRERLENVLKVHLNTLTVAPEVIWKPVKLPRITRYGEGQPGFILDGVAEGDYKEGEWDFRPQEYTGMALRLRRKLEQKLTSAINLVVNQYCPAQCILERIDILGGMVNPRDAVKLEKSQQIRDETGHAIFQIDNIEIDMTIDSRLGESTKERISSLLEASVRFASPVNLNIKSQEFPETYASRREREAQDANDPYGLNKLRNMLTMFRDLAGTKEIITTETSKESNVTDTKENVKNRSNINTEAESGGLETEELFALSIAGFLLLALLGYFMMRLRQSSKDAEEMLSRPGMSFHEISREKAADEAEGINGATANPKSQLSTRMKVEELKDELIDLFIENPKVAKETFSRFLKEDGVEDTAKYVHVFGHLIVFELLKDPNFQRELYELSEYYHNSDFTFTPEEEYDLLLRLKTRCTASEIRVLTRKSSEKFDFLNKLDATQIYNLIADEKIQVQAIVLTQLERKKRQRVFEMYVGGSKVELMHELSTAEAIPKDFLFSVAKALSKKVTSKPEFDTENLRTSDILLDLLEKAPLAEQRQLMANLQETNAETARSLKMRLVTVHMLPYLKDGHLLELVLGLDREDLLMFLSATVESIRDLLLGKAPEELADSWLEDMETLSAVDETNYRLVEMKVVNKIRSLANNGVISLLEINSMIFDVESDEGEFASEQEVVPELSDSTEVA